MNPQTRSRRRVDLDDYDFGRTRHDYRCPACEAELEQITPPIGSGPLWYWVLKPDWLRAACRLAKAKEQARCLGRLGIVNS